MSNLKSEFRYPSAIELILKPKEKDLGEFTVRRLLPSLNRKKVGPWVFFDHMGPAEFPAGKGVNVRPHPHIGLATVTYLFEGEILHRDSLGNEQIIKPGEINLMVSGKGIVHSEREREEIKDIEHKVHALQLWLALPEDNEEDEPAFFNYQSDQIPSIQVNGVKIKVMIGDAYGVSSPVKQYIKTLYAEADLKEDQSIKIPDNIQERAIYVAEGEVEIEKQKISQYEMVILSKDNHIELKSVKNSRIAIIGGDSISHRYIDWNFVSSSKERIERAKKDWREKNFPVVPGDEEEFIPLPE